MREYLINPSLEGIAIIGMAGRFPHAENIETLWRNLREGKEGITRFSAEQLNKAGISGRESADPNYVPARGILPQLADFDANLFNMARKEAELTDPQHRLMLETAWQVLEDAGYDADQFAGAIGVYAGMSKNTYFLHSLYPNRETIPLVNAFVAEMGNEKDYLATRISYKLNLTGPSVNVSTACSTSLVAVYHACEALHSYQCDLALAGGVSAKVPQESGYWYEEGSIASPDGHCKSYSADAQGTVFSNGVAMVALKRLAEAVEDGDHIYAVIRGIAINNDGAGKVNFGAPSVAGQAAVIALAQALGGLEPETIGYVEGHGTATPMGDPIEVAALTQAFREKTDANQFCALGSIKSNIGHLDAAAGVTGLIKATLAVQKGEVPPTLHFDRPNPALDLPNTPFYINNQLQSWTTTEHPRRAGVSAFGTGGTNAHAVLEQTPDLPPTDEAIRTWHFLPLSAATPTALDNVAQQLAAWLVQNPQAELADVAYTLGIGRKRLPYRRTIVAKNHQSAIAQLRQADKKWTTTRHQERRERPIAFMFPGQGSQYLNMGRDLYEHEPIFREWVDRACDILQAELGRDLRDLLYPSAENAAQAKELLNQTQYTQPAIFVISYALSQLWLAWGITPKAMIGHSVGEFVAAALAGVFTFEEALHLLAVRGRLMQQLPSGGMMAVSLDEQAISSKLNGTLSIAAINSPGKVVVSGPQESLTKLQNDLDEHGVAYRPLHTSHAFHSMMMEPMLGEFSAEIEQLTLRTPNIPFIASPTGSWISAEMATDTAYWAKHVRDAVRFADGVTLLAQADFLLLEVGPGNVLSTLAKQTTPQAAVVTSLGHAQEEEQGVATMVRAMGQLWLEGANCDWALLHGQTRRARLSLPTYPFERKTYWIEPPSLPQDESAVLSSADSLSAPPESEHMTIFATPPTIEMQSTQANIAPLPTDPLSQIKREIASVLYELSGLTAEEIEPNATFIELGLDSLFITQASVALRQKLGVKVTFRQLMEETPTVNRLAEFIAGQNPKLVVAQATPPRNPAPSITLPSAVTTQTVVAQPAPQAQQSSAEPAHLPKEAKRFGPWKPFDKSADHAHLSFEQQTQLDQLIARYTRQTAKSKQYSQQHRPHFTDPRAITSFKQVWKEMIYPLVAERSRGSRLWDLDGNEYIDMQSGFGSSLFGHSPDFVTKAVQTQLTKGVHIGPQMDLAGETAEMIARMTGMDRATFCNTGSEAVMAAMRIARTVTGRNLIVTFNGDYHGQFDEVLVRGIQRGGEPRTVPISPGVPHESVSNMLVLDSEDPELFTILAQRADEIAAVLIESVQSRRPSYQPRALLQQLRDWTHQNDAALIVDEVITGFRLHPRGAQGWYEIEADIATYGKVIGGGMPVGVLAGKRRWMDALDGGMWNFGDASFPEVGVTYFAGTFVRHPLVVAAAHAVVRHLQAHPTLQADLNAKADRWVQEVNHRLKEMGAPLYLENCGSMLHWKFFEENDFNNLFYFYLRAERIYIMEGRAFFLTTAHSDQDLAEVLSKVQGAVTFLQAHHFWAKFSPAQWWHKLPVRNDSQLPLTEEQTEIWLASQMSESASLGYNEAFTVELKGALNFTALRQAVGLVLDRHDAVHLRFSADGETQTHQHTPIELATVDLSKQKSAERAQHLQKWYVQEASHPFDLARGPLVRVHLIKYAENHYLLYLVAHHIAFDGWSSGVFVEEVRLAYTALCQHKAVSLPKADRWADYVEWELGQDKEEALAYWREQFAELPAPLQLPTDRPRPAQKSYHGHSLHWSFDPAVVKSVRQLAKRLGSSFFHVLLGGYQTLLYRLTGQDDFVVGIALAGQLAADMPHLLGHAVKLLPLRVKVQANQPFAEIVKQARNTFMDAQEHQMVSYGQLVRELGVPREPSRNPLVDVVFNLDRAANESAFHDLSAEVRVAPKAALNWDTFLNLSEVGETLVANFEYNSDLFDEATLVRWLESYQTLLQMVAQLPELTVDGVSLLSAEHRQQQLVAWNETTYPQPSNVVHKLIEAWAEKTPHAPAWVFEGEAWTYGELNERANQLGHYLQALGVGVETKVGIFMERSLEMGVAVLAVLKAGGCYVPLAPDYPTERVQFIMEDSSAPILLTQARFRNQFGSLNKEVVFVDEAWPVIQEHGSASVVSSVAEENLAYIIYTSGSTGRPKGAMIEHRALTNYLHWYNRTFQIGQEDAMVQKAPFGFDASVWEIFSPLTSGGRVVLPRQDGVRDPDYFLDVMIREKVTHTFIVPTLLQMLIDNPKFSQWRSLRVLNIGGEAYPEALREKIRAKVPQAQILNVYGPTETTIVMLSWDVSRTSADMRVTPMGYPNDNTQIYVLNRALQPCPIGVAGELHIAGAQLARGYLNRPELSAEKFIANPFGHGKLYKTGDLVRQRPDGAIEYLGRMDNQIKLRGLRIELGEIEAGLLAHPAIERAVVIVRDDTPQDKQIVAYLVEKVGRTSNDNELRDFLKRFVPKYMLPRFFVRLPQLPINPNGKLAFKALPAPQMVGELVSTTREKSAELPQATKTATARADAPNTPLQFRLHRLWQEALKHDQIGIHDNFFDLGGHSLMAIRLFAEIEAFSGHKLPLSMLSQAPTIAQLAQILERKGWQPTWSSLVAIKPSGTKHPLFHVGSYMESILAFNGLAKHFDPDRPFYGLQPQGLDGEQPIHHTVAEMAAHYIQEIKMVQPQGPYFIGGHCAGATVAYELVAQLERMGEEVAAFVIVDAEPPHVKRPRTSLLRRAIDRTKYYMNDRRLINALAWQYKIQIESRVVYRLGSGPAQRIEAVRQIHDQAFANYTPSFGISAELAIFRSSEAANMRENDWQLRWQELSKGRSTVDVIASTHATLLHEGNVEQLTRQINQRLNQLER